MMNTDAAMIRTMTQANPKFFRQSSAPNSDAVHAASAKTNTHNAIQNDI